MGAAKVQGQTKFWLSQVSILAFKIGQKTWLVATQLLEEFWWFLLLSVPWLLSYFIFMVSIYNSTVTHCSKPRIFVQKSTFVSLLGQNLDFWQDTLFQILNFYPFVNPSLGQNWFLAGHTVPKLHFLSKKSTLRKKLEFWHFEFSRQNWKNSF